jgi:putative FmdB family regulatory protein
MEEYQSMKDAPLVRCPSCGKDGLKRLIGGGSGMIFKGSGFYLTDYKNNNTASSSSSKPPAPKNDSPKPPTADNS